VSGFEAELLLRFTIGGSFMGLPFLSDNSTSNMAMKWAMIILFSNLANYVNVSIKHHIFIGEEQPTFIPTIAMEISTMAPRGAVDTYDKDVSPLPNPDTRVLPSYPRLDQVKDVLDPTSTGLCIFAGSDAHPQSRKSRMLRTG
jgi:hypothetical protein